MAGLTATAALAAHLPASVPIYPTPSKPADEQKLPYAMNYADEAAQTLGVKNGHLDVFSSRPVANNGIMPTVSGGVGSDGAMIRLQWRSGN